MMKPSCKDCGSPFHSAWYHKPRKPLTAKLHCSYCDTEGHTRSRCAKKPTKEQMNSPDPTTGKYPPSKLRKNGKYSQKWLDTRRQWFKANQPDHAGYYYCYICGKAISRPDTTLDHIKSRSRYPELRFEMTNLAPCCYTCNMNKGSKDLEEITNARN